MPKPYATPSFSMPASLLRRMKDTLPRYGDRSRLMARLLEMWLDGKIATFDVMDNGLHLYIRHNVGVNNIK